MEPMKADHRHQYIEMKAGKTPGNMAYREVVCPACGQRKRLHEDGTMEAMEPAIEKPDKS